MDWNITGYLMIWTALSLAAINLILALLSRTNYTAVLLFASLSLGIFSCIEELRVIEQWVQYQEVPYEALLPKLCDIFPKLLLALVILNLAALIAARRKRS